MVPERFIRSNVHVTFGTLSLGLSPMNFKAGDERPTVPMSLRHGDERLTFALIPEFSRRGGRVLRTSRLSQSAQFVLSEPNARCA
jgi:hypothetical protein